MIALLVVVVSATDLADVDLWRHLKFGADMIAHRGPLLRDPYSYSIRGQLWINHEWLSEVIFAWTFAHLGVIGLKFLRLVCATIAIVSLASAVAEAAAPIGVQLTILSLVSIGLMPEMQFRPQIFTYAMLSVLVLLLARDNYHGRAPLWIAIPMLALWANLHGGFVVGVAALVVYAIVASILWPERALKLAALVIVAMLATLITPFRIGSWRSAMHTIMRPPMLSHVSEWQSLLVGMTAVWHLPGLAMLFDVALVIVFAGFVLSFAVTPSTEDLPIVAVGALMLAATLTALRNIPLGLIGCAVPLARHATLLLSRMASGNTSSTKASATIRTQGFIALVAFALAIRVGVLSRTLESDRQYPARALRFMDQRGLHGNILCDYEWAGYVLFHEAPASRVFIDGRYEMIYPAPIARDFMDFYDAHEDAHRALDSYPTNFVLIAARAPARKMMDADKSWSLVYRDSTGSLYARNDSAAAKISVISIHGAEPEFDFP